MTTKIALLVIWLTASGVSANAQTIIQKCIIKGKVTYTNEKCDTGASRKELLVDTESVGTVDPDRATIEETRARIRAEMAQPGNQIVTMGAAGTSSATTVTTAKIKQTSFDKRMICDAAKRDVDNIDAAARQRGNTRYSQDALKHQKTDVQKIMFENHC